MSVGAVWSNVPAATAIDAARLTLTTAFSLAMLASLETLVVNSSLDQMLTAKVSGDTQLFSLGIGNIASGLVAGLPCAPSISRSALVCRNGGRTYAVQATYILLSALIIAFPQPLSLVPQSVLGASMILVAIGLIDDGMVRTMRQAVIERRTLSPAVRRQATENALVLVSVAVVGTLLGLIQAVIIGTVISTVLFLQHNRREVVRRVFRCNVHRSRRVRDQTCTQVLGEHGDRIAVVEAQGPLYFATADRLFSQMESLAADSQWLILDCRRVTHIDTTGVHLLAQLVRHLERQGVALCLSYVAPRSEVGETLRNLHLDHVLPICHWHVDTDHALEACENALIRRYVPAPERAGSLPLLATDLCRDLNDRCGDRGDTGAGDTEDVLRAYLRRHVVPAGELLFRRGDPGDSLYVVTAGDITLQIQKGDSDQSRLRLATYTPGVVFGEMAFLQGGQRSADARAETEVEIFELRRQDLAMLESAAPHLATQLLINIGRVLADRLRNCTQELAESEAV
jgi:SulP family sulfate permease